MPKKFENVEFVFSFWSLVKHNLLKSIRIIADTRSSDDFVSVLRHASLPPPTLKKVVRLAKSRLQSSLPW